MTKHTITDLAQMQAMPLNIKISMTRRRISEWIDYYGSDGVYVSFSGGKDSTVLLDIVRQIDASILAVFIDTGLEYPEIRDFVKSYTNVQWIRPKKTFKQVIEEYGYPFISKEVSDNVYYARKYIQALKEPSRPVPYSWAMADLCGIDRRNNKNNPGYQAIRDGTYPVLTKRREQIMGNAVNKRGSSSPYDLSKYQFFLEAPFDISASCCYAMKKSPAHTFSKQSGRKAITAQMASESRLRSTNWTKNGCNGFDMKSPISNPMSFWTEQDVLLYIKLYGEDMVQRRIESLENEYKCPLEQIVDTKTGKTIFVRENFTPICSVYGEIKEVEGQSSRTLNLAKKTELDWLYDQDVPFLRTTGCDRTGCMFCGYGCHHDKPGEGRFLRMKETHPKLYDYIMRSSDKGGLNYKEVIDWINENGGFHIEY